MAFPERNVQTGYGSRTYSAEIDQGLRAYMLKVYNYMAIGLAVTGGVAALAANAAVASWDPITLSSFGVALYTSPLQWLVMLAPSALCWYSPSASSGFRCRWRRACSGPLPR